MVASKNLRLWAIVLLSILALLWMLLWSSSGTNLVVERGCKYLTTIQEKDPAVSQKEEKVKEMEKGAHVVSTSIRKEDGKWKGLHTWSMPGGSTAMDEEKRLLQRGETTRDGSTHVPTLPQLKELPSFIINLKDRQEKRDAILSRTNLTVPEPKIIDAVDGRLLHRSNSSWTRGEMACFESHMKALRQFVNSGYPYGLILEDDANVTLPRDLEAIREIIEQTPPDWGAISLGVNFGYMPPGSVQVSERVYRLESGIILGSHAILYTQKAAKKLLDERAWMRRWIKPEAHYMLPYDIWLARPGSPAVLYFVAPALVSQKIEGSDTQGFQKKRLLSYVQDHVPGSNKNEQV